ncbi:MAG TPA: hypothetical protein VG867_03670 [Rhizomicrobium sp.]|nr:hypothetical protein [Rhizomicrobium sp.]
MSLVSYGIFVVAAGVIFALVVARRRSSPEGENGAMVALLEAASRVCETARHEKLALVVVAERNGTDPVQWFAQSIASVVNIWTKSAAGEFAAASRGDADLQSLYIRKSDIDTYLRWARTVQ